MNMREVFDKIVEVGHPERVAQAFVDVISLGHSTHTAEAHVEDGQLIVRWTHPTATAVAHSRIVLQATIRESLVPHGEDTDGFWLALPCRALEKDPVRFRNTLSPHAARSVIH